MAAPASAQGEAGSLNPCRHCGRTFNPKSLVKHQRVCQRLQFSKRPVFDSGRQRAEGSDVPFGATLRPGAVPNATKNKNNWRAKHREFVETIRNARAAVRAMRRGEPLPPPPPPADNPDYVYCSSCHRNFNPQAAARHIPFCKTRKKEQGEPMSYLGSSVDNSYGSKISTGKQYAKSVPKPKPKPKPRINSAVFIKRSNPGKARPQPTQQPILDPFHGIPYSSYDYDSPIPTRNTTGPISNSCVFPSQNYMGSSSPRVYQDQPCIFSGTGLTPSTVHGYSYGPRHRVRQTGIKARPISAKYRHMNGRKSSLDSLDTADLQDGFSISLPPMSDYRSHTPQRFTSKAMPRHTRMHYSNPGIGSHGNRKSTRSINIEQLCHRCGDSYPDTTSKFCCNCGIKRSLGIGVTSGIY
ncbi:zinc finger C2HC domain-containing protein 1A-like [Glandiceps talaboti]